MTHSTLWRPDQSRLSRAVFDTDTVHLSDIRNFRYRTETDYSEQFLNRSLPLKNIIRTWLVIDEISRVPGTAHTFFSFESSDETFLAVSFEARRKENVAYSPWRGLFGEYPLHAFLSTEDDALMLRAKLRRHPVFLFPLTLSPSESSQLFRGVLEAMNRLNTEASELYHTFKNNCFTVLANILWKTFRKSASPFSYSFLLPGFSDRFLLDHRFLAMPQHMSFREYKKAHLITEVALRTNDQLSLSGSIRQSLPL